MLRLADVHAYYGESCVLRGVSLEVPRQSVVALLGRNGMGKTTTVHSIVGLVSPRRGEITFKGQSLRGRPPHHIARAGMALVPQGRRLFPSLTVREHLTMAARPNPSGRSWSLEEVYAMFPILERRAHVKGTLLSGGEQQMLSIGRALMTSPDLLLLDEPSEGLAPLVVRELSRIFKQLHHQGLSILLVEQNLPLALATADYVYILSKGMIVYAGTPAELRADEEAQSRYLGVEVS
jgi:branched-chain amino acid transport system ATP-binding protein